MDKNILQPQKELFDYFIKNQISFEINIIPEYVIGNDTVSIELNVFGCSILNFSIDLVVIGKTNNDFFKIEFPVNSYGLQIKDLLKAIKELKIYLNDNTVLSLIENIENDFFNSLKKQINQVKFNHFENFKNWINQYFNLFKVEVENEFNITINTQFEIPTSEVKEEVENIEELINEKLILKLEILKIDFYKKIELLFKNEIEKANFIEETTTTVPIGTLPPQPTPIPTPEEEVETVIDFGKMKKPKTSSVLTPKQMAILYSCLKEKGIFTNETKYHFSQYLEMLSGCKKKTINDFYAKVCHKITNEEALKVKTFDKINERHKWGTSKKEPLQNLKAIKDLLSEIVEELNTEIQDKEKIYSQINK